MKKRNKKVFLSFIVPVFNVDINILKRCIDSIIACVSDNIIFEIIVVDDGSEDELSKQYRSIAEKYDAVLYLHEENSGSAVARNLGLSFANGGKIVFVDVDDVLPLNYRRVIMSLRDEDDISMFDYAIVSGKEKWPYSASSQMQNLSSSKNEIMFNILYCPNMNYRYSFGSIWAKVFDRDFLKRNSITFQPKLRKAQDRVFMLDCLVKAKTITYYPICSYYYILSKDSITHKFNPLMKGYYLTLCRCMEKRCMEYSLPNEMKKFIRYGCFCELCDLTFFHIDNERSFLKRRFDFMKAYSEFRMKYSLKKIRYHDIRGLKGKIKLFFLKYKMFIPLLLLSYRRQRKRLV